LLLLSTLALSGDSPIYAALGVLQVLSLGIAVAGLRFRIPMLHQIAAPASGLLMLNAAAVVGLHRFLFTRGPLWRIWSASKPRTSTGAARERHDKTAPKPVAVATAIETGTNLRIHSNRR
jgi:hypothetical protein